MFQRARVRQRTEEELCVFAVWNLINENANFCHEYDIVVSSAHQYQSQDLARFPWIHFFYVTTTLMGSFVSRCGYHFVVIPWKNNNNNKANEPD